MMREASNILVTGGCGFIGSHFIRALLSQHEFHVGRVVNLDALTYAGNAENLADIQDARYEFVHGDIGDGNLTGGLLRKHKINVVLNFAAESHVDRSIDKPAPFVHTNVAGTVALLESVLEYHRSLLAGVRFVQISTDEVYGSLGVNDAPFTEGDSYAPSNPYAASKAAADHFVWSFYKTYGLPVMVSHCSNNYGPYQLPEKFIPLMILNAIEGRPLTVYGDGSNIRDWIYVGDYAAGLLALLQRGQVGESYHFGGGAEWSNLALVREICSVLDSWLPLASDVGRESLIQFVTDRPGHDLRYAMNTSKVRRELGWEPKVDFQTGLRETIDWYLHHQEWCGRAARYARRIK